MSKIYTLGDIKSRVNANIQGRIGMLINPTETVNQAVTDTLSKRPTNSTQTNSFLVPFQFNDKYWLAPLPHNFSKARGIYDIINACDLTTNLTFEEDLDLWFGYKAMSVVSSNGYKYLKTNFSFNQKGNYLDDLDDYSNWVATIDAENITDENTNYIYKNSGVGFGIKKDTNTTAALTNPTTSLGDLTGKFDGKSNFIFYLYLPTADGINSIDIKIGSDSSNYYSMTALTDEPLRDGWNTIKTKLVSTSETGTVVVTAINYLQITLNKTSDIQAKTGCVLNGFYIGEAERYRLNYYSDTPWTDINGKKLVNATVDDDKIICEPEYFNFIVYKASQLAAMEADIAEFRIKRLETMANNAERVCLPSDELIIQSPSGGFALNTENRAI